ncbi:malonyl-CoA synthase [Maribius pontilimi]|uniref:Malonyl-CoA synthase n=1 Tax=Palleronia pontilimi TaxID=1964209 RepID=A0A934MDR6_9RHOB|nr:malonyl-CoA synthase [Palleronia pontilimi]MBJ3763770.1 malonyl-CoA synthase [Palleronia pontilimi]
MSNTLHDALFAPHADRSDTFLHLPEGGALSHADFAAMAARFAHVLTDAGLDPGERVAVQVEKSPQALALYAAAVQAGVIFLPLNTAYTTDELQYFVENSGAKMLVCDPGRADDLGPLAKAQSATLHTLGADGTGTLADAAASKPDRYDTVQRGPDDLAAFLYTSGTTGRSKGAMLSHANLLSNAQALKDLWRFTEDDVLLHALPIFHTHGLFVASNVTLLAGGSMIFLPKFDQDTIIAELPRATSLMGVPTFYTRLLDDDRFDRDLVSNMRLFTSGSAPLLAETHRRFEERTGHRILERYGMTETNMNTSNPYDGERRAGTVGFPLPGVELKITDPDTGDTLPQGEVGLIEVRGPNVFQGYWQMPEKTAAELRDDGFFITGDLGQIDKDGYVSIVGRDKDLIISGGYNIYPKEIEVVLDAQPGVLESAVIGVPHDDFGETPIAVLVPENGAAPDTDAIAAAVGEKLARYKHPSGYRTIDALPRNTMGKVQKNVLRDRFGDAG